MNQIRFLLVAALVAATVAVSLVGLTALPQERAAPVFRIAEQPTPTPTPNGGICHGVNC